MKSKTAGALDGLALGYMKRNRKKLPATSGVVGRGIKRSPGVIANCLERLEKAGEMKLTNEKPREYDLGCVPQLAYRAVICGVFR